MKSSRILWLLAVAVVILLLLLLSYCAFFPRGPHEESATTPAILDRGQLLGLDDAVVTGFSGTMILVEGTEHRPSGLTAVERTFIDINGPAARILNPRTPGFVWNGNYFAAPQTRAVSAGEVGQVFGIAIDDAAHPDIYLAATSMYGLNLVKKPEHDADDDDRKADDDEDEDDIPRRLHKGGPDAAWMAGQFGPGGGPSSIWRIDGRTGKATLFANITLNGEAGGPAALGNLAYDAEHRQLFVSDLSTGMIHRLDLAGRDLGHFDHGTTGRRAAGLDAVAFDSSRRVRIGDAAFDPENPSSWGFAPAARRVFGLAVHDHRLYYAVADGHIWSVGLTDKGDFADDPRKEIDLPQAGAPVSDIVFAQNGAMIVAQRAVIGTRFDYRPLAPLGTAHVWRFWPERPDDPATPSAWYQQPEEYAVGYGRDSRNSGGGVDLAYGYKLVDKVDGDGNHKLVAVFDIDNCEDAIVFTGDNLRDFHQTPAGFDPGGNLHLNGLQISPARPVRGFNLQPAISYFVNYPAQMDSADRSGRLGGVRVYRLPCTGGCPVPRPEDVAVTSVPPVIGPPPVVGPPPPSNPVGCTGPDCTPNPPCTGPGCETPCTGPDCGTPCTGLDCGSPCTTPDCVGPKVCMAVEGRAVCDPSSGGWVYKVTATDPLGLGIDTVSAYTHVPGVTVTNGPQISLVPPPGVIQLGGATPGQLVTIDVCGFNSNDPNYKAGKPYDCCHQTLRVRVPRGVCKAGDAQ
ncbi:MAG: hypothetical protein JSR60_06195 [Proteobacteria bacterium]|nr:hypothetical protein [Pseudomonadota bacterium]